MSQRPFVIVVTGGAGAGKSTATEHFASLGARVIDADSVAREVLEEPEIRRSLADAFGPGVLEDDGQVDRARLADLAFRGTQSVARLNAITHPRIGEILEERLDQDASNGAEVVVMDIPLLEEAPALRNRADVVLVIEAPQTARVARLVARGITERDAKRRIALQPADPERRRHAGAIVVNDGDEASFLERLDQVWAHFEVARAAVRPGPEVD